MGEQMNGQELALRCRRLRAELEAQHLAVVRDLRAYPGPVAGCDQQFNALLARRDQLSRDLSRLTRIEEAIDRACGEAADPGLLITAGEDLGLLVDAASRDEA